MRGSGRCPDFTTEDGRAQARRNLRQNEIDVLVVSGGDGSQHGSWLLSDAGFPVSGIASTVDDALFDRDDFAGKAVLVRTGWSRHWRTDAYFENHPYLTSAAAERLVKGGAAFVGIDTLNIDDTRDGSRPAHTLLLGAKIPIVEHLTNLESLPPSGFRLHCVPAPVHGLGSFPVRAYAIVGS